MPTENEMLDKLVDQLNSTGKTKKSVEITHIDRIRSAVCGDTGTGKSNLVARTCRKPLLAYDFDDRAESIAEIENVIIKTLVDKKDDDPVAWGILESDIGTLEYTKTQCKPGEFPFKSIMLDSMTFLRKYAEHQFIKDAAGQTFRKYKIGTTNYLLPQGFDTIVGIQKMLESVLSRLFALDVDIYVTFHTRPEKDVQRSTKENTVYKDSLTIEPPNLKMLLPKFNDKWRTFVQDGKYMVQLHPDFQFNAATVLKNVGDTEVADIQMLLEKHNKNGKV